MEACCVVPATPMVKAQKAAPATHLRMKSSRNRDYPSVFRPIYSIKAAEQSSGLVGDDRVIGEKPIHNKTIAQIKASLNQALQGINRGIFGVPSTKKSEIECLVELLEFQNPTPNPTQSLEKVGGCWKLVYSTITILGSKRTKLGLRDFITLEDFLQIIDISEGKAVNVINFIVSGLKMLSGKLTIEASFTIISKSRVDIKLSNSTITPNQLMSVFQKNYDLLVGIFNPEGWLEISYVDESMRIGRDDKGNIFVLERSEDEKS